MRQWKRTKQEDHHARIPQWQANRVKENGKLHQEQKKLENVSYWIFIVNMSAEPAWLWLAAIEIFSLLLSMVEYGTKLMFYNFRSRSSTASLKYCFILNLYTGRTLFFITKGTSAKRCLLVVDFSGKLSSPEGKWFLNIWFCSIISFREKHPVRNVFVW